MGLIFIENVLTVQFLKLKESTVKYLKMEIYHSREAYKNSVKININ